mgnify:FL=1
MPIIYENPEFTEAEELLEQEALQEATDLSTSRLFSKLLERDVDNIRMTSLLNVLWKLPHLVDFQQLSLQYIGRNVLVRAGGFLCGPTIGPVPQLYTDLLQSCKDDPLCTFLLRLSGIPRREIGEVVLNVLLQVLPYDQKHMRMSDRMDFCARMCNFLHVRRKSSEDLLPLLLCCKLLAKDKLMIPWFRKPLIEVAPNLLKHLLKAIMPISEEKMDRIVENFIDDKIKNQIQELSSGEIRRLKRIEVGKEKRFRLTEKEKFTDAFDIICQCLGDLCENDRIVGQMILDSDLFDTLLLPTYIGGNIYDSFVTTIIYDLMWRWSFSNKVQIYFSEKVYQNEGNLFEILLTHAQANSKFVLQSIGILWNSFLKHEYVSRMSDYFDEAMNERIDNENHLLNRVTKVVIESDDLEVLTVACGLSAELLTTDFTLFYMTQQDGYMDKIKYLSNLMKKYEKNWEESSDDELEEKVMVDERKKRKEERCCKEANRALKAARA